jgi:hypothetical protein
MILTLVPPKKTVSAATEEARREAMLIKEKALHKIHAAKEETLKTQEDRG